MAKKTSILTREYNSDMERYLGVKPLLRLDGIWQWNKPSNVTMVWVEQGIKRFASFGISAMISKS